MVMVGMGTKNTMNDTQILEWIAEHLTSFRPVIDTASMCYVDDAGIFREIWIQHFDNSNPSCIEQLRECVKAATNELNVNKT